MLPSLLRKFKVIRCPLDNAVLRPRAFITHIKNHHPNETKKWTTEIQKQESCLICTSSRHHSQPKVELTVSTRQGNDTFIKKHAAHLSLKQVPLSEIDKEIVRQKLNVANVDIDASPPPPPIAIPSPRKAVGVVQNWQQLVPPQEEEEEEEEGQTEFPTRMMSGFTPPFSNIPETSTPQMDINKLEASLHLDEHDPLRLEMDTAELINTVYKDIYKPGLQYPSVSKDQSTQVDAPSQHHASTSADFRVLPELNNQSMQVDAPSLHHASTSMSELRDEVKKTTDRSTSPTATATASDTEDIPLLTQGVEHIREVNKMKNVMLTQIMQDNIDLLESKVQSRKRALQLMEELFEARAQEDPMSDDITLELSRIVHLKNKFIQQLLHESARLHPQIYNMMQN